MIQHLPEELWPEAISITQEIKDEESRSNALSAMAGHLSEELWPEALTVLHSIQEKYYKAQALKNCLIYFNTLTSTFTDWAKSIDTLAYQNRSELIELLPILKPIIMRLGDGEETFSDVLQSVREVCRQWP